MGSNHFLCSSLKISSISNCFLLDFVPAPVLAARLGVLVPAAPSPQGARGREPRSHTSPSPSSGPKISPTLLGTPSRTQRPPQCRRLAPKPQPSPCCQTAGPAGLQTNKF